MTKIIGLTGGIATGKSTVSAIFQSEGIPIIDADEIVYELERKGEPGLQAIVDRFGERYLTPLGELDRRKFATEIFASEEKREDLNELLDPLIRQRIDKEINRLKREDAPLLILDIPLLYERDYASLCDEVLVVSVDEATQLKRLKERNQLTSAEAEQRIDSQMSLGEKRQRADHVIDNSKSIDDTKRQVINLLKKWR